MALSARQPAPPQDPELPVEIGNLVVVSPTGLAEACFSVPAVRALRHGRLEANLTVLAPESIVPLWNTVPQVDRVLSYPDDAPARVIAQAAPGDGFDASFHWDHCEAARALAKAGVPRRYGYDLKSLRKRLTDPIAATVPAGPVEHRVRFYMGLIEKLGFECYVPPNFAPPALPARPTTPRLALVPGSSFGPSYCWPLDRFRELGEAFLSAGDVELVLLAHPGQDEAAGELDALLSGRARNYASEFDLAGLLEALPHCSAVVANDGAVAHLAAHVGVPVVALFGPGDPVARRPLGRQHHVLSEYVECSPCNRSACPLHHHRCLRELPVDRVRAAVSSLLETQARSGTAA